MSEHGRKLAATPVPELAKRVVTIDLTTLDTDFRFSEKAAERGQELLDKGEVTLIDEISGTYRVGSLSGSGYYIVRCLVEADPGNWGGVPLMVMCSCPHGQNNPGRARCYHAAAVVLLLTEKYDRMCAEDAKRWERQALARMATQAVEDLEREPTP